MKKRKFADGGETTEMRPSAKPEGGRFDEDTYARARRFVESGGKKEETKTAVKKARKVEVDPTAGEAKEGKAAQRAADMMETAEDRPVAKATPTPKPPVDPNPSKAPASTGESTSGPSNIDRILLGTGIGAGAGALGMLKKAYNTTRPADRIARAIKSAEIGSKSTTPIVQSAKSTTRNYPNMKNVTLKRKASGDVEYKKGGSVKKYAKGGSIDGIAQRGKTRGRMC